MRKADLWRYIGAERSALADTWESLSPQQWNAPSWCEGWTVRKVAGHVLAAAEQTPLRFLEEFASAGFKFDVFADRGAEQRSGLSPEELVRRLRARTTTHNHPPGPVSAMLGEIVVHGDDMRRPLGLSHASPEPALVAVADAWKATNVLIGSKKRIEGLRLKATDAPWSYGDGPELSGPLQSLVLVMTGRTQALSDLSGDGVSVLARRAQ
ncbi:MAG: hypothetical protein JWM55_1541 [Acidimicrobiaceae bacterium]|nr:hypothetical protein [Acidimicrobiaceae bacterium]